MTKPKFKSGDKVLIEKPNDPHTGAAWPSLMDEFNGKIYTISSKPPIKQWYGFDYKIVENEKFWFTEDWLFLVISSAKPEVYINKKKTYKKIDL